MNKNYNTNEWDKQFNNIINNLHNITNDINDYLLDYFKNSFVIKSFGNDKWKQSRNNQNTLIESGELKKSIKTISKTPHEIHIQSDTPYSAIHNYGGRIKITNKMRKFFWSKFYSTGDDSWKWMALNKSSHITIPQRQFMGYNQEMNNKITDILKSIID